MRKMDYDVMFSQAKAHRDTANLQRVKLKSLSKQGKGFKGAWLLRLHQEVWQHEWVQLVSAGQRMEVDGEKWRANALITATEEAEGAATEEEATERDVWIMEVIRFMAELYQDDTRKLEQDMLCDLQLLQADLKKCIKLNACPEAGRGHNPHWTELQRRLESAKLRLTESEDVLRREGLALWDDIRLFHDAHFNTVPEAGTAGLVGVAPKTPAVTCSNQALRASLLKEFDSLSQRYQLVLQQLEESHSAALG